MDVLDKSNVSAINNVDGVSKVINSAVEEKPTITTLADLQTYAEGKVVKFPDFAEGQPLVARVRRPSLLVLAKTGKIPNSLLSSASDLFMNGGGGMQTDNEDNVNLLADMYDICVIIAESCLITPTVEEINNSGMVLTDEQLMAIFNYSQEGVKALESFR
jgi:hypothetical protein